MTGIASSSLFLLFYYSSLPIHSPTCNQKSDLVVAFLHTLNKIQAPYHSLLPSVIISQPHWLPCCSSHSKFSLTSRLYTCCFLYWMILSLANSKAKFLLILGLCRGPLLTSSSKWGFFQLISHHPTYFLLSLITIFHYVINNNKMSMYFLCIRHCANNLLYIFHLIY